MRRLGTLILGVSGGLALLSAGSVHADVLYGISSNTPSTLYQIDTGTGVASVLTTLNNGIVTNYGADQVGLAMTSPSSTSLYATDVYAPLGGGGAIPTFGVINTLNGNYTPISSISAQTGGASVLGIAPSATAGTLYAVDNGGASGTLYTVNAGTGAFTSVGALSGDIVTNGENLSDIAYDSGNGTLIGVSNGDNLYSINTSTGATTAVGAVIIGAVNYYGLTYDSTNNRYLLSTGTAGDNSLYAINPSTYAVTLIGSLGATAGADGQGIDGIAFGTATPEPATIALTSFAIPALGWWVVKRRKAQVKKA